MVTIQIDFANGTKTFDKTNLLRRNACKANNRVMPNNSILKYGIISQDGHASIYDSNRELAKLNEQGLLSEGLPVRIYYGNRLVGDYISGKWDYNYLTREALIPLNDTVYNWRNVLFSGKITNQSNRLLDFFQELNRQLQLRTGEVVVADTATLNLMARKSIPTGFLPPRNMAKAWITFCQIAQGWVFKGIDGTIRLIRGGSGAVRNIFKGEILKNPPPKSNFAVNNQIRGVFGEVTNIAMGEQQAPLTHTHRYDNYLYEYTRGFVSDNRPVSAIATASTRYSFNYDLRLSFRYMNHIENPTISVKLVCRKFTAGTVYGSALGTGNNDVLFNHINRRNSHAHTIPLGFSLEEDRPSFSNFSGNVWTEAVEKFDFNVADINEVESGIIFRASLEKVLEGRLHLSMTSSGVISEVTLYQPEAIEIIINGDIFRILLEMFTHGAETRAFEIKQNTLLTTDATVDGIIPLSEFLTNQIIRDWRDGKQSFQMSVLASNPSALYQCGDIVRPLNAIKEEIDISNPGQINRVAFARKQSGEAKTFLVTRADLDPVRKVQDLDLQEI